jgi:hypothetical protein
MPMRRFAVVLLLSLLGALGAVTPTAGEDPPAAPQDTKPAPPPLTGAQARELFGKKLRGYTEWFASPHALDQNQWGRPYEVGPDRRWEEYRPQAPSDAAPFMPTRVLMVGKEAAAFSLGTSLLRKGGEEEEIKEIMAENARRGRPTSEGVGTLPPALRKGAKMYWEWVWEKEGILFGVGFAVLEGPKGEKRWVRFSRVADLKLLKKAGVEPADW